MKQLFYILFIIAFFSCKKSKDLLPDPTPIVDVPPVVVKAKFEDEDTWIYKKMKSIYLWEDKMPDESKTDKNLSPDKYFASLINQNGQVDRVSYFKDNKQDILDYWNGTMKCFGFKYRKFQLSGQEIGLAVSLVYKNGAAQKKGIWRGDIITKINGTTITSANLENLLANETVDFSVKNTENKTNIIKISKEAFQIFSLDQSEIIELDSVTKVGYVVYSQFLSNTESEFRRIIGSFKTQKIKEMVLDLRFNQGGVTPNAEIVSSLFVKNNGSGSEMFHSSWNKEQTLKNKTESGDKAGIRYWTNEPNNIGTLNRIFILTSKGSASSSELLINALKPFMEVITIGDNTFGKNLISIILTDETNKFNFSIMPAYTYIYNSKGENNYGTIDGIAPTYRVEDNLLPFFPLGNKFEPLLNKALKIINPKVSSYSFTEHTTVTFTDRFHHQDTGNSFIK